MNDPKYAYPYPAQGAYFFFFFFFRFNRICDWLRALSSKAITKGRRRRWWRRRSTVMQHRRRLEDSLVSWKDGNNWSIDCIFIHLDEMIDFFFSPFFLEKLCAVLLHSAAAACWTSAAAIPPLYLSVDRLSISDVVKECWGHKFVCIVIEKQYDACLVIF